MIFKNKAYIKNDLKYFFIFILFFTVFFIYQLETLSGDITSQLVTGILVLFIFFISVFNIKTGLYTFIFLIPIVNFFPEVMGTNYFMILLLLFFPLFLGFIINKSNKIYDQKYLINNRNRIFDINLAKPIIALSLIFFSSLIITFFKYANFSPFITNNYHNLFINIKGLTSNYALHWVVDNFFNYIIGFLLVLIIINVIDNVKEILKVLIILISSTVFSSFIILYQNFKNPLYGIPKIWINSGRFNATFSDPNALGSYSVLLFPIFLIMIFFVKKVYQKIIFTVCLIFFFILIFFSGSRSALLGIILEILIFLIIWIVNLFKKNRNFQRKKKLITSITIILIFILLVSGVFALFNTNNKVKNNLLNNGVILRMANTLETFKLYYGKDGLSEAIKSISNYRYIYWERAYQMGRDYLLNGVGIGGYILELPDYNYRYNRGFQHEDYAGNYYLQMFAEFGITGLILILFIFFEIIKKFVMHKKNNEKINKYKNEELILTALFMSFISMAFILFFGSHTNFIEVQFTFWLIIGLILSFINLKSNYFINIKDIKKNLLINDSYVNQGLIKKYSRKIYINNFQIIALCVIVLIFSGNLFINSFNNLSLNIKENVNGWKDKGIENTYGFYGTEDYGSSGPRWIGIDAHINLMKEGVFLSVFLKAKNPDIKSNPVYVKVFLDNKLFTRIKLSDSDWHKIKFKLPKNDMAKISLTYVCSRTWVPKEWGVNDDTRELGVLVGQVEFSN